MSLSKLSPRTIINMLSYLLITLITLAFLITLSCVSSTSPSDIKTWCSQTPHPKPCEHGFMSHKNNKPMKTKSDFLKASFELSLQKTLSAQRTALSLGPKCRTPLERAAWDDCLALFDLTILSLNKTLDPYANPTQPDTQTWLSTALTNLETCKEGFDELSANVDPGARDYMWSSISNDNVTQMLSNSLALNCKDNSNSSDKGKRIHYSHGAEGFPTWMKPGDRRLLQSSSSPASQANVVVAKDGSGKYTTVNAAVSAAPKSSSARYVIYVKAGVYNEQVNIKGKNIMLVGDGIGKTIITGSKSVGGGSTTFNSATVGKQKLIVLIFFIKL